MDAQRKAKQVQKSDVPLQKDAMSKMDEVLKRREGDGKKVVE